jgi:hypothetical protein
MKYGSDCCQKEIFEDSIVVSKKLKEPNLLKRKVKLPSHQKNRKSFQAKKKNLCVENIIKRALNKTRLKRIQVMSVTL